MRDMTSIVSPRRLRGRRAVGLFVAAVAALSTTTDPWSPVVYAQSPPTPRLSHIHGIAVDPADPSALFLATHYGLYRMSPDGTASLISNNQNDYMGFTTHPNDASLLYASGHPAGGGNMGVIISRDGGRSWEQLSPGANGPVDFHAITISQADPQVMYGSYGRVQVSRDGGMSWDVMGSPPDDVFDLAASAVDPAMVYAATRGGLFVSRDWGANWEPAGYPAQPAGLAHVGPDGGVYAFVLGTGLVRSSPYAFSWTLLSADFEGLTVLHLAIDPTDTTRMYAVAQDSSIFASSDGGQTWGPWPIS